MFRKSSNRSLLTYSIRETNTKKCAELFIEGKTLKLEGISFLFGNFMPPISVEFAFNLTEKDRSYRTNSLFPIIRNRGFGTKMLKYAAKKIKRINRLTGYKTVSISGKLDIIDLDYWKYSLPMYYSFAKSVIGPNAVCLINGEVIEEDKLAETAYKLNDENTAVNFEFAAK